MSIAIAVGLLTAAAVYLFMQRGMVRIVLGFVLASHAANLMFFAAGNTAYRGVPYIGSGELGEQADPLPQAFVLTAIVIAFSITMFMVTLAITTTTDDDTEDVEVSPALLLAADRGDTNDAGFFGLTTESGDIVVERGEDETGDPWPEKTPGTASSAEPGATAPQATAPTETQEGDAR
ncbi:cation:proton antiporter subunit C [Nesterenkonia sp. LB17]|uniref:sodium:proton antiporter n=1 Tax=unclassified Nesterenkonia TaxID=2629769 RepID=UPI001F4CF977|nr:MULTISPECIES: cation:proton antiporter subunit C [unclassified Nesterenkonia]MCH8564513.1 cation:proton antiporter subunit C [Nesterenkonia sp. LB17]MCH8570139.1 cation:proton antiporter subunit C [Nesterenkonia sp. AY15]